MHRWTCLALALGFLVACGGSAENDPSGAGGNGASGSGAAGATGGSGGDMCSEFAPPDVLGPTVTVRLVNQTGQDIYLGKPELDCESVPGFELSNAAGPLAWQRGSCSFTCAEAQSGSCACAADCAAPVVTLLADGASYSTEWQGTVFTPKQMPAECYDPGCGQTDCVLEEAPPPGELELTGTIYTDVAGCDPGPCTCTPDATGTCIIDYPATVTGMPVKSGTKIPEVSETTVDILFDALPGG